MKPDDRHGKTRRVIKRLNSLYRSEAVVERTSPPLDVLISTILSQNTNDRNSEAAWKKLRRAFRSWDEIANAGTMRVARVIREGGLPRPKARAIKGALKAIKKRAGRYTLGFLRQVGDEEAMTYLRSLNGVGPKTAACVLVFGLGREVFPVDTHIHRVLNRLGLVKTTSAEKTFEAMKNRIPRGRSYSFHLDLLQFGKEVCRSSDPRCHVCPLYDECRYPDKHRQRRKVTA